MLKLIAASSDLSVTFWTISVTFWTLWVTVWSLYPVKVWALSVKVWSRSVTVCSLYPTTVWSFLGMQLKTKVEATWSYWCINKLIRASNHGHVTYMTWFINQASPEVHVVHLVTFNTLMRLIKQANLNTLWAVTWLDFPLPLAGEKYLSL